MPSPVPSPVSNSQIPAGATAAGKILATAIAAPTTPSAGIGAIYVDSTSKNLAVKNDVGVVSHGARTKASVVSQFLTAIADDGTVAAAQPAFTDISGALVTAQITAAAVTYAKIQNVSAPHILLGRKTAGAGSPEEILNSGTTAGRIAAPELINIVTVSATTTASMTTITAGTYREIRIISRTTGSMTAGAAVKIRFNGDSTTNYWSGSTYVQGTAAVTGNAPGTSGADTAGQLALTGSAPAVDLTIKVSIDPLIVTGCSRDYTCTFVSKGSTDALGITGTSNGFWKDTTNGLTDIIVLYGSTATGTCEFWGIPA